MKLATYVPQGKAATRIGVLFTHAGIDYLIDAAAAQAHALEKTQSSTTTSTRLPGDMKAWLEAGESAMQSLRDAVAYVGDAVRAAASVQALVTLGLLHRLETVRLLAPIPRPGKIIAVGANYHEHILEGRESGAIGRLPSYPPAFLKMSSAVVGPDEAIVYPAMGDELDYEVELSMVIGRHCKDIQPEEWLDVVAGFTIVNDLSLRDVILQEKDSGIVLVGKNFATSCPMGPYLVTKDEITTPDDLAVSLRVNGEVRQRDRTSSMIHNCSAIVAYWSRLGLEPGDVITTGTPGGGAGFGRKFPQRLLKVGDLVEAEIEGIGVLRNAVIAEPKSTTRLQNAVSVTALPA